jgi:meiosis induction protein kinase IME2/SME1
MQRYSVLETVGDGSFGTVYRARCLRTGDIVAIKHIKTRFPSWNECLGLREVASLTKLRHENIIRLRELIYVKEDGFLNFVFEFADGNLYSLLQGRKALVASADKTSLPPFLRPPNGLLASGLREDEVRVIAAEVLRSLSHMHKHGFFHRDLKPENILITSAVPRRSSSPALTVQELAATHITLNTAPPSTSATATPVAGGTPVPADSGSEGPRASPVPALSVPSGVGAGSGSLVFKLCDFGQARETRSRPPYTAYVSTRWYRAPEVVLGISHYNSPIDLWAAGAVLGELITGRPLFPGTSALNQIYSIAGLVGPLLPGTWQEGFRAAAGQGIRFSGGPGTSGPAGFSLSTSLSYLPSPSAAAAAGGGAVDFNVGASGGTAGGSGVYGAGVGGPPPPAALAALLTSAGASAEAVEVVAGLLRWDPAARLNASEALAAPFFRPFVRELEERDREVAGSSSGGSGRARTSTSAQVAAGAAGGAGSAGADGKRLSNAGSGAAALGSGSVGWSEEEEQWRARDRDPHAGALHRPFRPSFAPAGGASSTAVASSASVVAGGLHAGEGAAAEPTVVSARRSEGGAGRHPSTASLSADAAAIATAAVATGGGSGTSRSHSSGGASASVGAAAAPAAPPSFDLDAELAGLDLMRPQPPTMAGQTADSKATAAATAGAGRVAAGGAAGGHAAGSALPLQRPPQPRADPSAATSGAAAGADAREGAAAAGRTPASSGLSDSRRHAPSDHAASAGSSVASASPAAASVGVSVAAGAGAGGPARHKRAGSGAGGSSGGLFSCMTRGAATGTPPGAGWEEGSADGDGPAGNGSGGFLASLFQGRRGKAGSPVPQQEAAPAASAPRVHSLTHVVPTTVASSRAGQGSAPRRQQEEPGADASLRPGAAASGPQTPATRQKPADGGDASSSSAGSSDAFALSPLLRETEAALAGTAPQPQHMQRASSFTHHHSATTGAGATAFAGTGSSAQLGAKAAAADRPVASAPSRPKPAADPTVDDLLAEIDSA